jgi:hypothetical protein
MRRQSFAKWWELWLTRSALTSMTSRPRDWRRWPSVHVQEDDLAMTLLSEALAELEREPADIASALDRVPGAMRDAQRAAAPTDD